VFASSALECFWHYGLFMAFVLWSCIRFLDILVILKTTG